MVEEIFNLFLEGDLTKGKKYVKKHYDEIGELVYAITVSNEYLEGPDGENAYAGFISYLSNCNHLLDYCDEAGNSALHGAVNGQDPLMVMAFNERKELFTKKNKDGITPIMLGFTKENEDIKKLLASNIGDSVNEVINVNGEEMTYLTLAIYTSSPDILPIILLNESFDYEFHKKYLNEVEWDDSKEDEERQNYINNYLDQYVNLESDVEDDDFIADSFEEKDDLENIHQGITPLIYAVFQKDWEEVKSLIKKGANVNHRNNYGITPVMVAVLQNDYEMTKYLLEQGAYLECPLADGLTPIIKAIVSNDYQLVKLLLDNKVYLDKVSKKRIEYIFKKNDNIDKKIIDLVNNYNNPKEIKRKFPFESVYELGFNECYEGDGFYQVVDVFAEKYGSNMINEYQNFGGFGLGNFIIKPDEEHKVKKGIMFTGPVHLNTFSKFALLYEDGSVDGYIPKDGSAQVNDFNKWKDIKQIVSTNYVVIGLTKDGKIVYNDGEENYWLKETDNWRDIKKIAAGNDSLFALTNDGELKVAMSNLDKMVFKDSIAEYQKEKNYVDLDAYEFSFYLVRSDGTITGGGKLTPMIDLALQSIVDAVSISVNKHIAVLRKDHTVMAFGDSQYCQCNVVKWHDIDRIQTTHFSTIGYASNGDILCTDYMFVRNNDNLPMMNAVLWGDGFGNAVAMGSYVPDAINLSMEEVK